METIPYHLLTRIERVIDKYNLFNRNEATVAYSGGKDSLFLCKALHQMGYKVRPLIIDIGYNVSWERAIRNINRIGLPAELINMQTIIQEYPDITKAVNSYFNEVLDIQAGKYPKASPCTPCHNAKMTILSYWAKVHDINYIATGHHGTDAITSLLKSYFMYVDRWEYGNVTYSANNYERLIKNYRALFQLPPEDFICTKFISSLKELLTNNSIGTDESIVNDYSGNLVICRPLYDILEYEIVCYYKTDHVEFAVSECFVSNIRNEKKLTPREMVQYWILRNANIENQRIMINYAYECLDEEGRLLYNVRNNRKKILGGQYKNDTVNIYKL